MGLLPLVDVGSRKFEEMCLDLVKAYFPELVVGASLKRQSGVGQFGVDVEGFDANRKPAVVVSAKCYRDIKAWDFRPWIEDFTKHLDGHWKGKDVRHFVLAITHETNDDAMNDEARRLVRELDARGIRFHLWNAHILSETLRDNVSLVDRYFNKYWVDAISAATRAATPGSPPSIAISRAPNSQRSSDVLRQLAGELDTLSAGFSKEASGNLESSVRDVRAGRPSSFWAWFRRLRETDAAWEGLDGKVRVGALQMAARLEAHDGRLDAAEELLEQVRSSGAMVDGTTQALVMYGRGQAEGALELLAALPSSSARELRVAILIEASRLTDAGVLLSETSGDDVTPEILRLRSIVHLLQGNISEALEDAASAHERAPNELAPLLNLAKVRFHSVLAAGVEPTIGRAPEPIAAGLVLDGTRVHLELTRTADDFRRASTMVDDDLRSGIETWRLAALLLLSPRTEEARVLARELLGRPVPDPLAVAWCVEHGLVEHSGRLKRALGNALRAGSATAEHLVMFAVVCSGADHPERGRRLLTKFGSSFPDAADYLARWLARFDDREAAGSDHLSAAFWKARHDGDNGPLISVANSGEVDVRGVLSIAEYLTWRRAWSDLVLLSGTLVRLGTRRGIELAAMGFLKSGDPASCLRVVAESAAVFEKGRLPASLIHARISANQTLGRYEPVLQDLTSLRRDADDAYAQDRIMDAYVRIGDLERLRKEAENALDRGTLVPEQALQLAYILRASAPSVARKALTFATTRRPAVEVAGSIMTLANELGLPDLRETMMRMLLENPAGGGSVVSFDTVEDIIAFMEARSREHREKFSDWLHGRTPFAVATAHEVATFGRMFLGGPTSRRDSHGDPFPMLLRSGVTDDIDGLVRTDQLNLDLTALLTAHRFGLLDEVEKGWTIRVPPSAAEALIELEACFRSPSGESFASVQDVLDGRSAIRLVDKPPAGALVTRSGDDATELDEGVFRTLVARSFRAGHIDRFQADEAYPDWSSTEPDPVDASDGICLNRWSATLLARTGYLEQFARATPLFLTEQEAVVLRRQVESAIGEGRFRESLGALRRRMADRLSSGDWLGFEHLNHDANVEAWPAQVKCLLETLHLHEHGVGVVWIEDRAISNGARTATCPQVLDALLAKRVMTGRQRMSLLQSLAEAGYAFLPMELDEFLQALSVAPLQEGRIRETPQLAALRLRVAAEAELLRYLNLPMDLAPDTRPTGEVRRMLEHAGLARDLLSMIWRTPGIGPDDRLARSNWVWLNLRMDRIAGLPADLTPEARRHFLILQVACVLDVPLLALLDSDTQGQAHWRTFLEWVMAVCVRPLCDAEPSAKGAIVDVLAAQLEQILDRPEKLGLHRAAELGEFSLALVADYLRVFPEDWGTKLADASGFTARGGRTSTLVLQLEGDDASASTEGQVPLAVLSAIYDRATDAGVDLHSEDIGPFDGLSFKVEVQQSSSGGLPTVRVRSGRHSNELSERVVGLISGRAEARVLPDSERRLLLHSFGSLTEGDLRRIERIDDLDQRYGAYDELIDGDLYHRLQKLRRAVMARGGIELSDLVLPEPAAATRYFDIVLEDDLERMVRAAAVSLTTRVGREEAFVRLASLPISLIADLPNVLGSMAEVDEVAEARRSSPMLGLFELQSLVLSKAGMDQIEAAVAALSEVVERQGSILLALVRLFTVDAARRPDWRAMSARDRYVLVWACADQYVQNLCARTSDAGEAADWIARRVPALFAGQFDKELHPSWYAASTFELTLPRLAGSLFGAAMRAGLGDMLPLQQTVKNLHGHETTHGWMPRLELLPIPPIGPAGLLAVADPLGPDALGSLMRADNPFGIRTNEGLARRVLGECADERLKPYLAALLSNVNLEGIQDILGELIDAVEASGRSDVLEPDSVANHRSMMLRAALLSEVEDDVSMTTMLAEEAKRSAMRWPEFRYPNEGSNASYAAFRVLFEAALRYAFHRSSQGDRYAVLGQCMRTVVDHWPAARENALSHLDVVYQVAGFEAGASLWPSMVELRKRR